MYLHYLELLLAIHGFLFHPSSVKHVIPAWRIHGCLTGKQTNDEKIGKEFPNNQPGHKRLRIL
jgi:hypothetical protein